MDDIKRSKEFSVLLDSELLSISTKNNIHFRDPNCLLDSDYLTS
jgi:hypothetical protein